MYYILSAHMQIQDFEYYLVKSCSKTMHTVELKC